MREGTKNSKFDMMKVVSLHKMVMLDHHTTKDWTVANTTISATDGLRPSPSSTDFWDKSWFRLSSNACCFPSLPAKSLENFTHFITYAKGRCVTYAVASSKWVWCTEPAKVITSSWDDFTICENRLAISLCSIVVLDTVLCRIKKRS